MKNNSVPLAIYVLRRLLICLLILWVVPQSKAENTIPEAEDPAFVWVGVEIVTNDDELEGLLRSLTEIHSGDVMRYSDPRLKNACAAIRSFFPRSSINCTGVLMSGATSLYVVEFSLLPKSDTASSLKCRKSLTLPADFETLAASIDNASKSALLDTTTEFHEFVNTEGYLDSTAPKEHDAIQRVHGLIKNREAELSVAVEDCAPRNREIAFRLLNFLGKPELAVKLASESVDDPSVNVRNNAMRLLSSFSKYIAPETGRRVTHLACENVEKANFLDRNKGVSLIWAMLQNNVVRPDGLDIECVTRIRRFAKNSKSDQIGAFSRLIVKKMSGEVEK